MPQLLCHLFGDYLLQSDWMAQNKTKEFWPAWVHAWVYTVCFFPLYLHARHPQLCLLVIFGTHFLIDRYRLARYVVWAKNWMGPVERWKHPTENSVVISRTPPFDWCPTGYPPDVPVWLSTWLLIIADNTLHLTLNYLALRYL
jgi:hypothetical protein